MCCVSFLTKYFSSTGIFCYQIKILRGLHHLCVVREEGVCVRVCEGGCGGGRGGRGRKKKGGGEGERKRKKRKGEGIGKNS